VLICAERGVFLRRCEESRRDAWHRFYNIVSVIFRGSSVPNMASLVGVVFLILYPLASLAHMRQKWCLESAPL
jgi:hypothetical protein